MTGTGLEDVLLVNASRVRPSGPDEVTRAEAALGVRMPSGYAAFVEKLGEGVLGHFVRVDVPGRVPERTLRWRQLFSEHWFWDTSEAGVAPEDLQKRGVVLANSFDGDQLCFDPVAPEALFILPRNDDVVRRLGPGFISAIEWMLSGALNPWVEGWTFEAMTHRVQVMHVLDGRSLKDAVRALADLGKHSHVVDFPYRTTFFLPAIGGRLSLYDEEGKGVVDVNLTYDETADPAEAEAVMAAVRGN